MLSFADSKSVIESFIEYDYNVAIRDMYNLVKTKRL